MEEARELGRKGGKASGEARRKKKFFKEAFEELLSMPLKNEKMKKNLNALGFKVTKSTTVKMAVAAAMVKEAYMGNVKAFVAIRDTIGERQIEEQDSGTTNPDYEAEELRKALLTRSIQGIDDDDEV